MVTAILINITLHQLFTFTRYYSIEKLSDPCFYVTSAYCDAAMNLRKLGYFLITDIPYQYYRYTAPSPKDQLSSYFQP